MSVVLWKLTEYPNVIEEFEEACKSDHDKEMLAALKDCLRRVEEKGPACGRPTSKNIGNGLYEIRPKTNRRQGRVLYTINEKEKKITFLCWFFKTTEETPRHYIDLALKRSKKLEHDKEKKKGGNHHGERG